MKHSIQKHETLVKHDRSVKTVLICNDLCFTASKTYHLGLPFGCFRIVRTAILQCKTYAFADQNGMFCPVEKRIFIPHQDNILNINDLQNYSNFTYFEPREKYFRKSC